MTKRKVDLSPIHITFPEDELEKLIKEQEAMNDAWDKLDHDKIENAMDRLMSGTGTSQDEEDVFSELMNYTKTMDKNTTGIRTLPTFGTKK